jgi:hypothetical protein
MVAPVIRRPAVVGGVPDGVDTGYEFVGIENDNVVSSPDGMNVCQSPLQVVLIPLVPEIGGLSLFAYGPYSNDYSRS